MKLLSSVTLVAVATRIISSVNAFVPCTTISRRSSILFSTMAESGIPPVESVRSEVDYSTIPTKLPSECGMDYVPLATMLASGDLAEADQFTRDALITIAGSKAKGRTFVYFTEVKDIPNTDLATIERLWNQFSKGKFGYSVQKKKMAVVKGDFEMFCKKIGWTTQDGDIERKKRWFGASEFTYDVKKAQEGHLPLTSALRGTTLIKKLLEHPVWDNDDWKNVDNYLK